MFKLWFMLEFNQNEKQIDNKKYLKFVSIYILPTLFMMLLGYRDDISLTLTSKGVILLLLFSNLTIMAITYFMIHKYFFKKLETDVVIKFLPDKMDEYIKVRLFMILIKFNLPFISSSILCLKPVLKVSNLIFCLTSILFLISWFIINYLIVMYSRYIINVLNGKLKKILSLILKMIYSFVLIIIPTIIGIVLIQEMALRIMDKADINYININNYHVVTLTLIVALCLFLLRLSNNYFKLNIRKIIINNSTNYKFETNGSLRTKIKPLLKKLAKILLRNLSVVEQKLLIKDIKDFYRENKNMIALLILSEILMNSLMVYICYSIAVKNIAGSIELFMSISIFIFINIGIKSFFLGILALRNIINITTDLELFNKYNIKISKNSIIKVKQTFVKICLFYPMFIFYIIVFITTLNYWVWLGILLSIIPTLIIVNLISVALVKFNNKTGDKNVLITLINTSIISVSCLLFINLFNLTDNSSATTIITLWISLNVLLIIDYLFNVNIDKIKKYFKKLLILK